MGIESWSSTPSSNNAAPPAGAPEGMAASSVNDVIRQNMADIRAWYEDAQWINPGLTPTRVSASQFTLSGDVTARWDVGRKVRMTGSATAIGTISASVYSSPNTTITVTEGNVPGTLSTVSYGIISGALNLSPLTASQVLAMLMTVDGTGSGLDADMVDGVHAASFLLAVAYNAPDVLAKLLTVDGAGTGLDADLLDGQQGAFYQNPANLSGTVPNSKLPNVGSMPGVTIQSDPGGTPSGSPGQWFLYY